MVEHYYELEVKPASNYPLFLDLILSLTNEAIEESNNTIIARSEYNLNYIEFGIATFAKELGIECKTKLLKLKNKNWIDIYKKSIEPVEIGDFYIHPTWQRSKNNKINIIIDPALSFGSGHHETTSNCLIAFNKYLKKGDTLLDVGTGSGILAIAAAKLGATVDICDTDSLTIDDAKSNFEKNSLKANKSWCGSAHSTQEKYDIVVANIVADVLLMIASDLKKCLRNDATLILSGILDKHLDKVLKKYKELKQIEILSKNEWVTVILKNTKEFNNNE